MRLIALALLAALAGAPHAFAQSGPPEGRLLRFPDIHRDFVVFVYGGDLWRAPSSGGPAHRLTSHVGLELFPKVSPDGRWIAFSAEYTGTRQVYVMPSWGGEPRQLTFYNDVGPMPPRGGWDNWVLGWTPEGKVLVRMNRVPWSNRMGRYFVVDPAGGLETPLELPEGGSASLSADGRKIAYTPVDREFRTWKRTRGGRAQDVWTYDFEANRSARLTDHPGTDNFPMWAGNTVYFTSDRDRTLNIYAYDLTSKAVRRVTSFTEYDVLWPSLGPDDIVFENGGYLYRLPLSTERPERIPITLAAAIDTTAPQFKDVKGNVGRVDLSPSASRVVLEARGEVFTVPAKEGATRNLTETPGVRERAPTWSPDGKSIAYLSDATGEYEVYVRPQNGGEARRLTTDGGVWRFAPVWSPDSTKLAFGDRRQRLRILEVASGRITDVDTGTREDLDVYTWSPDGRWLAYEKSHDSRIPGLAVYSLEGKRSFRLGDGLTPDSSPVFSRDGRYLFFLSNRDFNLTFSAFEFNYLYTGATRIFVAALGPDVPPLFPPRSDEETGGPAADKTSEETAGKPEAAKPSPVPPVPTVSVVADGFNDRTTVLPGVGAGNYRALAAAPDAVYYIRGGGGDDGDGDGGETALMRFSLEERKEEKVLDGVRAYVLSRDGKKLLFRVKDDWFLADAKAGLKAGEGKVDLGGLDVKADARAEWAQMFEDGWRIARDWFYDPNMHGVDWPAMKKRYGALVPFVAHRSDLDFIFGEMLGELEAGHTYVAAGDEPKVPRVLGGMLGAELVADPSGRYRIARIYQGENWDEDFRSPLTETGVRVEEGSFLLAIDGHDLHTTDNPYRLLENKAKVPVVLEVADTAAGAGAREVTVRPVASELGLLYLDWVRSRMALADKLSGGKVGYIHLPDTSTAGNRMLQKLFYSQAAKPALIVDDRYNGGGFIPDRMIEYFTRRTLAYWARRGIESFTTPRFAHDGPKAMLVNAYSASGGDALPYFFRLNTLGPIIGTRTWGGLIGLSGNPALMDGGAVLIPTFRIYDPSGRWVVENEGITPDVEVIDLPERRIAGGDPSLEKAVELLLEELKKAPAVRPPAPTPPRVTPPAP
ncbi:MAG TPA: PDZ domain-containing protein [Vicinamibacteria bacterium]|nr:PDZ domain-containing protein [Vicinamibacteria bacterium]